MAKHLAIYHQENKGDPDSFEYSVAATFKKNLERQISEAVSLKYSDPLSWTRRMSITARPCTGLPQHESWETDHKERSSLF